MQTAAAGSLAATVARTCLDQDLLAPGARVLVAVSAGVDSAALASLLAEGARHGLPLELVLGHVDHGWRGAAEASADLATVARLALRLGLALERSSPPPPQTPRTEEAARRWRYRWLAQCARRLGCPFIVTGHHAGDQAETFLMRLLRGSGLVGLAGIPRRRPLGGGVATVVRPLLDVEPSSLRAHAAAHELPWREDPTNADLARDRAQIRARLARHEGGASTLAALARRLRRRLELHEARLEAVAETRFRDHRMACAVEMPREVLAPLRGEDLALMLRVAGRRLHADRDGVWLTRRHVARIEALLAGSGSIDLPRNLLFHGQGRRVWLARRTWRPPPLPALVIDRDASASGPEDGARVDAALLGDAPRLRLLEPGDRFAPQGRGGEGEVDVVRWLSRRGYPRLARRGQLVVEGAAGIAWLVGVRVDRRHVITPSTTTVARLALDWSQRT
jgi:tRNA(Ile)-lysidine synthetase-like protein